MNATIESRIRDRAYAIWEAEGHPEGEELRHWEMARIEVMSADKAPKSARTVRRPDTEPTVELTSATVKAKAVKKSAPSEKTAAGKTAKPAKTSGQTTMDA